MYLDFPFYTKVNVAEKKFTLTIIFNTDGFPIYGPLSDDSSLDSCNGRTVNGSYQYHVRVSEFS